ncbi:MAG: serine hydrolase [Microlunatus sp.]
MPTEPVHCADQPCLLPTALDDQLISEVTYEYGESRTLVDLHRRTHTTGFLVWHQGRVLHESYPGVFGSSRTRFQLFSLTKSVTSMLVGIAVERGEIGSTDDQVVSYLPDLRNSSYDGVTVEHLLAMSSGVAGIEDWTIPDSVINRFSAAVTTGGSVLDVILSTERVQAPGTAFNYSTIDTHVLGWVLESATGSSLARYAERQLWQPMGAETDAYYFLTRGRPRTALGGGSLNATVRDLARVGAIMARNGRVGETQLVPEAWVERSRGSALPHLQVGALNEGGGYPHYGYANQWWTLGGERRAFTGLGVHGQFLWVDPPSETVIVKTSAWNTADDEDKDRETCAALAAIVLAVEARAS